MLCILIEKAVAKLVIDKYIMEHTRQKVYGVFLCGSFFVADEQFGFRNKQTN